MPYQPVQLFFTLFCLFSSSYHLRLSGSEKQKVEPLPSVLLTSIVPPCLLTICSEIYNPKPRPGKVFSFDSDTRKNLSNTLFKRSFFMPIPKSWTQMLMASAVNLEVKIIFFAC